LSTSQWIELIIAGLALLVLFVASWIDITLSAAGRVNVRRLLDERFARLDEQELERNQRVRSEMQLVSLLAGALAAVLITNLLRTTLDDLGFEIGLVVSAVCIVVIGRIWPRFVAGREPDAESTRVRRVTRVMSFVFAPIVRPITWTTDALTRDRARSDATDDVPHPGAEPVNGANVPERDADQAEIEQDEQEMITGVLHLERATARDIMVPRIDIVAVSRDVLIGEAVDVAIQAGHSRIPVYGKSIDEIVGVVYAKDMLRFVNEDHESVLVSALLREAYFVPESKKVDDLLGELQLSKVHLAVVVDEYGGTAGVVTIEDILEEIVGEIQDEFDSEELRIEIISPDEALADGALSVEDLSDDLHLEWSAPVSGTIGGLMQRRLGRIPVEGEVVELDGIRLTVLRVERRRVRLVRIERLRDRADGNDQDVRAITADTLSK
jgi:putative hemolysin